MDPKINSITSTKLWHIRSFFFSVCQLINVQVSMICLNRRMPLDSQWTLLPIHLLGACKCYYQYIITGQFVCMFSFAGEHICGGWYKVGVNDSGGCWVWIRNFYSWHRPLLYCWTSWTQGQAIWICFVGLKSEAKLRFQLFITERHGMLSERKSFLSKEIVLWFKVFSLFWNNP